MMRRRYGVSLARPRASGEDVNPNSYLGNIADCMLVLVLGLVVALIMRYGADLQAPVTERDDMTGVEVNLDDNGDGIVDDSYEPRGTVYYDNESGKYYLLGYDD